MKVGSLQIKSHNYGGKSYHPEFEMTDELVENVSNLELDANSLFSSVLKTSGNKPPFLLNSWGQTPLQQDLEGSLLLVLMVSCDRQSLKRAGEGG